MRLLSLFLVSLFLVYVSGNPQFEKIEAVHDVVAKKESLEESVEVFKDGLKGLIDDLIESVLGEVDPLIFPYLPLLATKSLSLSLTQIEVGGFKSIKVGLQNILNGRPTVEVEFPNIHLYSGHYTAGGHFAHLPVVGKGKLNVTADSIRGALSYERENEAAIGGNYCVVPGSTQSLVTIDRLIVEFGGINPGQDTGEVINSMISSIGTDITIAVTNLLNGPLADTIDNLAVRVINNLINQQTGDQKCDVPTAQTQLPSFAQIRDELEISLQSKDGLGDTLNLGTTVLLEFLDEMEGMDDIMKRVVEDVMQIFD